MTTEPQFPRDHNEPADDVMLAHEVERFVEDAARLAQVEVDETTEARIADLVARERKLRRAAEQNKDVEKRPLLDASREIDARFNTLVDRLKAALEGPKAKLRAWMIARDEARAKAEAEARAKAEAAAREAAALAAPDTADPFERRRARAEAETKIEEAAAAARDAQLLAEMRTRAPTMSGRAIGLKRVKRVEITDYALALAAVADHPDVRAAALKALTARARAEKWARPIPGVRFAEEQDIA